MLPFKQWKIDYQTKKHVKIRSVITVKSFYQRLSFFFSLTQLYTKNMALINKYEYIFHAILYGVI